MFLKYLQQARIIVGDNALGKSLLQMQIQILIQSQIQIQI